jgi:hypothetical protein
MTNTHSVSPFFVQNSRSTMTHGVPCNTQQQRVTHTTTPTPSNNAEHVSCTLEPPAAAKDIDKISNREKMPLLPAAVLGTCDEAMTRVSVCFYS